MPERPDRALASCRGAGAIGGPVMRDGPAELSSGVRATGSDRGAPRSTAMAASGDVRFGDDAGRPSGGVEPALPHYRPRDTRGRCDRGGLGEGGPALVGAAAKRSAGAWRRGMPHCSNEQHSIAARRRFAGRVRRHRAALACRKSDCSEEVDCSLAQQHGENLWVAAPHVGHGETLSGQSGAATWARRCVGG